MNRNEQKQREEFKDDSSRHNLPAIGSQVGYTS